MTVNCKNHFTKLLALLICSFLIVASVFIPVSAAEGDASFTPFAEVVNNQTVAKAVHGDKYDMLYHTKIKSDTLFDEQGVTTYTSNSNAYWSITLKGWGSAYEGIYINFYVQDKGTDGIQYWFNLNGQWRSIGAPRAATIGTTGLDIFIAHIGKGSKAFAVYLPNDDGTTTLLYTINASQADHIYEVTQTAHSTATAVTVGYEINCATVADAATAFTAFANKNVSLTATVGENVTSDLTAGTHRIGDLVTFTAQIPDGYMATVTANGEKLTANNNTYSKVITAKYADGIEFSLTAAKAFDEFDTEIGNVTNKHGDKYNFIYQIKIKSDTLFDEQGVPTYTSDSDPYYDITLKGWGSSYEGIYIKLYVQQKTNGIEYWVNLNGTWRQIANDRAEKIGTTGLNIFIAHIGKGSKAYGIFLPNDNGTATLLYTINASQADHIYEITQKAHSSATAVITGYETGYGTMQEAANALNAALNQNISVTATVGENVTSNVKAGTYHIGDIVEFTAEAENGYFANVTANGEKMTADGNKYTKVITVKDKSGIDFALTAAKAFDEFETVIGSTTKNHGDKYNFVYHIKLKNDTLFNEQGVPAYTSNSDPYYSLALKGWGEAFEGIYIKLFVQDKGADGIQYWFQIGNAWRQLSNERAVKIGTTGLDIFIAHIGKGSKAYGIYLPNDNGNVSELYTYNSSSADHVYELTQSVVSGTVVTTGYETGYATAKEAANALNAALNQNISVTATVGENVTSNVKAGTYHIGDVVEFTADAQSGYFAKVTANGEKMTADGNKYSKVLTVKDLSGVSFNIESGNGTEEFVSLIGNSDVNHGDTYGKFVYAVNIQSDSLFDANGQPTYQDENVPYFTVQLKGWGKEYEGLTVDLLIQPKNTGIEYWFKFTNKTKSDWRKLNADIARKIGGQNGLNLYIAHNQTDEKKYDIFVETVNSDTASLFYTLQAADADHVYEVYQSVKDGGNIVTHGYTTEIDDDNATLVDELFWKKGIAATGDINDDGNLDLLDLVKIKKYLADNKTAVNKHSADYNMDRELNAFDLSEMCKSLLSDKIRSMPYLTATSLNTQLFYNNTFNAKSTTGADPFCMKIEDESDKNFGKYILMTTGNGQELNTYIGTDLANWKKNNTLSITDANGTVLTDILKRDLWAPEMVYDKATDKYYMYFSATPDMTADVSGFASYDDFMDKFATLPYVAVSDSYDGPFVIADNSENYKYANGTALSASTGDATNGYAYFLKYSLFDPYSMWARLGEMAQTDSVVSAIVNGNYAKVLRSIDYHPFEDTDGKKYIYFSCTTGTSEVIFGMEMTSWTQPNYATLTRLTNNYTYTLDGASREAVYERNNVNEGAWLTKHNGKYYLTMSINSYGKDNYKVIQAVSDSPLGAYRKLTMEEGGILLGSDRVGEVSGAGHHSIVEVNGELYIVYHTHQDVANPSYLRYVALDKVEWVSNSNGLEVMYVNGATRTTLMPLPAFVSGYSNVVPDATVTATNVKSDSSVDYLSDKLINSKGSSFHSDSIWDRTYNFGDNYAKNTILEGESVITVDFAEATTVRGIMIYNADDTSIAFDNIEKIEFTCEDGTVRSIANIPFDKENNTYTYLDTASTSHNYYLGAAVAEFNDISVNQIKITVKPNNGSSYVGINELVVLGK